MADYAKMSDAELNAAVAEKVMGWTFWQNYANNGIRQVQVVPPGDQTILLDATQVSYSAYAGAWDMGRVPPYSTDIAAAWEVVERVIGSRHVRFSAMQGSHMMPSAEFFDVATGMERYEGFASTMPRAICLAALAAVGAKEKTNA